VQQIGSGTLELTGEQLLRWPDHHEQCDRDAEAFRHQQQRDGWKPRLTAGTLLLNKPPGANNGGLAGGTITLSGGERSTTSPGPL